MTNELRCNIEKDLVDLVIKSLTDVENPSLSQVWPFIAGYGKTSSYVRSVSSSQKKRKASKKRKYSKEKRSKHHQLTSSSSVNEVSTDPINVKNSQNQGTTLLQAARILKSQGIDLSLLTDPHHVILDHLSWIHSTNKWQDITRQLNELNCAAINTKGHCSTDISAHFQTIKQFSVTNLDLHSLYVGEAPTFPILELWMHW